MLFPSSAPSSRVKMKENRCWLVFVLIVSKFSHVGALHFAICFNSDTNIAEFPRSIGDNDVTDFAPVAFRMTTCRYEEGKVDTSYNLEVRPIRYKDDYLFGWFNLKLSGQPNSPRMRWTVAQALATGTDVVPGEFVRAVDMDSSESCKTNYKFAGAPSDARQIQKRNYAPCLYAQDPSPTVSYGFGLAVSDKNNTGPTEMYLNYRLTFPICGFYNERSIGLYFRVYIMSRTEAGSTLDGPCLTNSFPFQWDVFFKNYVGGAHDPPPPKNARLDCSKDLLSLNEATGLPPWVHRITPTKYTEVEFSRKPECTEGASEQSSSIGQQLFYGRCQYYESKAQNSQRFALGFDMPHYCETKDNPYYKNLPQQSEVIKVGQNKNNCGTCQKTAMKIKEMGMSLTSDIGRRVYSYRQGHALFMIIACVFFTPISHFVAHFYKETFFNYRIAHFHLWYSIHVNGAIMTFLTLVAAQTAGISARLFFGYSKSIPAILHVVLGWINIAMFVIVLVFYDFRCRNPKGRYLTIFLHYLGGSLFSIFNTLLMILSCYIPGSPSARYNPHDPVKRFEFFKIPLLLWVAFDLGITIYMNFAIKISDKRMKFKKKRRWAFFPFVGVPIPMLRPYSTVDLQGDKLRKILLYVYVGVSVLVTLSLIVLVFTNPMKGRTFGRMVATHGDRGKLKDIEVYDDEQVDD